MDSKPNAAAVRKPLSEMTDEEFRAYCGGFLEAGGWKRETAGEDWERGVRAFAKSARTKEPRRCGILVTGPFGCGKTLFISAALRNTRFSLHTLRLANRADLEEVDCESENYDRDTYENIFWGDLFLDDLGAECLTNSYGIKRDLVGELIVEYHYRGRGRLHITTNLTPAELLDRYGGRVADRIKELCIPLAFKTGSKRKWSERSA